MDVLSTGDVAKICGVSQRMACKFFDSGKLRSWRIPGSRVRRTNWRYLREFLLKEGMGVLLPKFIACISKNENLTEKLSRYFQGIQDKHFLRGSSNFDAGILTATYMPSLYVVDFSIGLKFALALCVDIRKNSIVNNATIIALLPNDLPHFDKSPITHVITEPYGTTFLGNGICVALNEKAHAVA